MKAHAAQLLVIVPGGEFRIALGAGTTSIGTDPACTLAVKDPDVSSRHCILQRDGDRYEIFDLFSTSGTFVNGSRVESAELRTGDQIALGAVRLVFLRTDEIARPAQASAPARAPATATPSAEPEDIPLADDPWSHLRENPFFIRTGMDATAAEAPAVQNPAHPVARSAAQPPPLPAPPSQAPAANRPEIATAPYRPIQPEDPAGVASGRALASAFRAAGAVAKAAGRGLARFLALLAWPFRKAWTWAFPPDEKAASPAEVGQALADVGLDAMDSRTARHFRLDATGRLVQELRSSPFLLLSLVLHLSMLVILARLFETPRKTQEILPHFATLETTTTSRPLDALDEPPPEIPVDPALATPSPLDPAAPVPDPKDDVVSRPSPLDKDRGAAEGPPLELPFTIGHGAGGGGDLGLERGGDLTAGSGGFRDDVHTLQKTGLDIVFVIDSTGSMQSVIDATRNQIGGMVATLAAIVPGYRLGVVTFRDRGDAYVTRAQELTPHPHEAVRFLDGLAADGGGDEPEAVLAGLKAATGNMRWNPAARRIIILVGDAPPHANDVPECLRSATEFAGRKGAVHAMVTAAGGGGRSSSVSGSARNAFQQIAEKGKGVCVALTDGERIIREVLKAAFGGDAADGAANALDLLEGGWRTRHYKELVRGDDLAAVAAAFRTRPPPEVLFRELARARRTKHLPVYFDALAAQDLPRETRWAAAVLLTRALKAAGSELWNVADELSPEGSETALRERLDGLRRAAAASGLPTTLDPAAPAVAPKPAPGTKKPPK